MVILIRPLESWKSWIIAKYSVSHYLHYNSPEVLPINPPRRDSGSEEIQGQKLKTLQGTNRSYKWMKQPGCKISFLFVCFCSCLFFTSYSLSFLEKHILTFFLRHLVFLAYPLFFHSWRDKFYHIKMQMWEE